MTVHTSHACNLAGCDLRKEPEYEFRDRGCDIPADSELECRFCKRSFGLIEGDGEPAVCYACVEIMARIINEPETIDAGRAAAELAAQHSDVVGLRRQDGLLVWDWIAPWPRVEKAA